MIVNKLRETGVRNSHKETEVRNKIEVLSRIGAIKAHWIEIINPDNEEIRGQITINAVLQIDRRVQADLGPEVVGEGVSTNLAQTLKSIYPI